MKKVMMIRKIMVTMPNVIQMLDRPEGLLPEQTPTEALHTYSDLYLIEEPKLIISIRLISQS